MSDAIVTAVGLGCKNYSRAAGLVGVNPRTLATWLRKGEEGEEPFAKLLSDIREAEAKFTVRNLAHINVAASEAPQWAAWLLEHVYPEDFGRGIREHTGPGGGPIQHEMIPMDVFRAAVASARVVSADGNTDARLLKSPAEWEALEEDKDL